MDRMVHVSYTQRWRMEDWIRDMDHQADHAWSLDPQINWLIEQGYKPRTSKHYDRAMDILHYILIFDVPESIQTFLLLQYPESTIRHNIGE